MLKIGSFTEKVPAHTQIHAEGQSEFMVFDMEGTKPAALIARSKEREVRFTTRKDAILKFHIAGKNFISLDARKVPKDSEEVSDIPYEIPDDNQAEASLEEKLKLYLSEMVKERFGPESGEFDTFEEAMDFDEEDDFPLSGFEVPDIIDEEPTDENQAVTTESQIPMGTDTGEGGRFEEAEEKTEADTGSPQES